MPQSICEKLISLSQHHVEKKKRNFISPEINKNSNNFTSNVWHSEQGENESERKFLSDLFSYAVSPPAISSCRRAENRPLQFCGNSGWVEVKTSSRLVRIKSSKLSDGNLKKTQAESFPSRRVRLSPRIFFHRFAPVFIVDFCSLFFIEGIMSSTNTRDSSIFLRSVLGRHIYSSSLLLLPHLIASRKIRRKPVCRCNRFTLPPLHGNETI